MPGHRPLDAAIMPPRPGRRPMETNRARPASRPAPVAGVDPLRASGSGRAGLRRLREAVVRLRGASGPASLAETIVEGAARVSAARRILLRLGADVAAARLPPGE